MKREFLDAKRTGGAQTPAARTRAEPPKPAQAAAQSHPPSKIPSSLIPTPKDYTAVYQKSPLILISDTRCANPGQPYYAYFPPKALPGGYTTVFVDADLKRLQEAARWPAWNTPVPSLEGGPSYAIREAPGRGLAMFATRAIPAGTLVIAERPLHVATQMTSIPRDMRPEQGGHADRNALARLSKKTQEAFLSLSNCHPASERDDISGRLATNNLQVDVTPEPDDSMGRYSGCFETLSRANNSCTPNMNYFFDYPTFTGRFYSVEDIAEGQELTIFYGNANESRSERQAHLQEIYRFKCDCPACSLDDRASKASDLRRQYIHNIVEKLLASQAVRTKEIDRAMAYASEEHLEGYIGQICYYAVSSTFQTGDVAIMLRAPQQLLRALRCYTMLEGEDSRSVKEVRKLQAVFEQAMPGYTK